MEIKLIIGLYNFDFSKVSSIIFIEDKKGEKGEKYELGNYKWKNLL